MTALNLNLNVDGSSEYTALIIIHLSSILHGDFIRSQNLPDSLREFLLKNTKKHQK